MINLDNINNKKPIHNKYYPYIPDHPYRLLIIGGSGSGKTNTLLLNLLKYQPYIDKIYMYAKDLSEPKYKFLINKREKIGTEYHNDPNIYWSI